MLLTRVLSRMPLLRFLPRGTVLTLFQGRLAGMKWIAGAGVNACWMGAYEPEQMRLFEAAVTPGGVVFDVGAHAGLYTLLAARLVGPAGRAVAFEPLPRNLAFLRRHVALNALTNVTVVPAAVCARTGVARFLPAPSSSMGRLAADGPLQVRTVALDDLISGGELPPPDVIKIDVEGAEVDVLAGADRLLHDRRPVLLISTHGRDRHEECRRALAGYGYIVTEMAARTDRVSGEPDGLLARPA